MHTYVFLKLEHLKHTNTDRPRLPELLHLGKRTPLRFKTAAYMVLSHMVSFYSSYTPGFELVTDLQELRLAIADIEQELKDGTR